MFHTGLRFGLFRLGMSCGTHEVTEFTSLLFRVLGSVPTGGFVPVTSPALA